MQQQHTTIKYNNNNKKYSTIKKNNFRHKSRSISPTYNYILRLKSFHSTSSIVVQTTVNKPLFSTLVVTELTKQESTANTAFAWQHDIPAA